MSKKTTRHSRRKARFKELFMAKHGCCECGNCDPRVLQLDHVDPADAPVHSTGSRKTGTALFCGDLRTVFEHLRLTQILCANCHAIKMFENGETGGGGRKHERRN